MGVALQSGIRTSSWMGSFNISMQPIYGAAYVYVRDGTISQFDYYGSSSNLSPIPTRWGWIPPYQKHLFKVLETSPSVWRNFLHTKELKLYFIHYGNPIFSKKTANPESQTLSA